MTIARGDRLPWYGLALWLRERRCLDARNPHRTISTHHPHNVLSLTEAGQCIYLFLIPLMPSISILFFFPKYGPYLIFVSGEHVVGHPTSNTAVNEVLNRFIHEDHWTFTDMAIFCEELPVILTPRRANGLFEVSQPIFSLLWRLLYKTGGNYGWNIYIYIYTCT